MQDVQSSDEEYGEMRVTEVEVEVEKYCRYRFSVQI